MKCEICKSKIAETFLKKPIGTYIKDAKGKKHTVCNACQKKLSSKEELLKIEKSSVLTEEKDIKESSLSKQTSESHDKTTCGLSMKLPRIRIRRKNERERLKNKNKQKMASSSQDLANISKKGIEDQLTFTKTNRENEKEKIKIEPIEKKTKGSKWNGENQLKKSER